MRIVMTGSNGVIGRVLLDKLVAGGHETIALLRPGTAPRGLDKSVTVIEVDLAEPLPVRRLPERADAVVHLAHSRSYRDFPEGAPSIPDQHGTHRGARRLRTPSGCLAIPVLLDRDRLPKSTRIARRKGSDCAREFLRRRQARSRAFAGTLFESFGVFIARLFYVYGPGREGHACCQSGSEYSSWQGGDLARSPRGTNCPLYSDDAAHVLHEAISENWTGTWNVGHPESTTIRHLATDIGRIIGREPLFEQVSFSAPIPCLPCLDRLAERVDLSRFVPLREGLSRMFVDLRHVTAT